MPRVKHHRSSRRVPPPKDSDFDHEINLVNHNPSPPVSVKDDDSALGPSRASSAAGPSAGRHRESIHTDDAAVDGPIENGDVGATPDGVMAKGNGQPLSAASDGPLVRVQEPTPLERTTEQPGIVDQEANSQPKPRPKKPKTPESAIDILYENQRGGFLCGTPLFSSKALGNLDPPPWTNFAHKASPTDITNAQVPDPTWEWAWPEWKINLDDGVDEDGWEYSFMFAKKFSWHKARWWNSFVRRRAWIRKRVKKDAGYISQDVNMLNPEYFTIRSSADLERSPSRASARGSRVSMSTVNAADEPPPDIESVEELLAALRASRIDREKIEAIDNYLENAEDDLAGLQDVMHEVMSVFVFQASRRALLSRLTDVYDKTVADREKEKKDGKKDGSQESEEDDTLSKRVKNLAEAVKQADEQVKKLEYWSDVKMVVTEGDSKGAVDEGQGWDPGWQGVDKSGPKAPSGK